jgi:outer membrane immunogenic protein
MKNLLLGCAALAAAFSVSVASAADMTPVFKAAPPAYSPAYNWSGFYAGLNGGYSAGSTSYAYSTGGVPAASGTLSPGSFIGGAQLGYNYQAGVLVFGVEGDVAWRNGTATTRFFAPNGVNTTTITDEHNWVATLRPRVGIASNNWLVYGTGGIAIGALEHSYTEAQPAAAGATRTLSDSTTRTGWTGGGGVEFAPSNRWSLGLEYLYQDFGKTNLSQPAQTVGGVAFPASSTSFTDRSHVIRGKVDFKFGWDGPVSARN